MWIRVCFHYSENGRALFHVCLCVCACMCMCVVKETETGRERESTSHFYLAASLLVTHSCQAGLPRWFSGKESTCQCRRCRLDAWLEKISWRRKCPPTPVFVPGKSHGQKSLVACSPWGSKDSATTEGLSTRARAY